MVIGQGDDAQLLAGATLARLSQNELYHQITSLLNNGLDDRFAKDPIGGRIRTGTAYMPGRFARRSIAKTAR